MTELKVLSYPHPTLKSVAKPVKEFDAHLSSIVKQMFEIMYKEESIVGLAAPQVGLNLRLFVMDTSPNQNDPVCLINPIIIDQQGECVSEEGCLTLPGVYVKVKRAKVITVEYQNEQGEKQTLTTEGLTANAIQHEIDHLEGILLLDKISNLKRIMALKKIEKAQRMES